MSNIFRELYYGNIQPTGRFYSQNSPFVKAAKRRQKYYDKLMTTLNKQQKELFDRYCNAQSNIESIARYDIFSYTLKLGIKLMTEVFAGKGL